MSRQFDAMIGVGGIGTGSFFALNGNHTLGREESRTGHYLDRRDYCKLHIISHYVKTLLGPEFRAIPVGKVGDDDPGRRLLDEMSEAGLDLTHVEKAEGKPTLFSYCFIYPDGSGGNMTTDDSACGEVDAAYIRRVEPDVWRYGSRGIALAVPEVAIDARAELLQFSAKYDLFSVASFTCEEIPEARDRGLFAMINLLAVNIDEVAILGAPVATPAPNPTKIIESAITEAQKLNPKMLLIITAGGNGSWSWDGSTLRHIPAFPVEVIGTSGAGDAHLSGVIAGLADELPFPEAHRLGALVGALSVTSPHTINKDINRRSLLELSKTLNIDISPELKLFLEAEG